MCVMSPPLVITGEQVDDMVAILREGISRTMDDLRREGLWRGESPSPARLPHRQSADNCDNLTDEL